MKIAFLTPEYPHPRTGNSGGIGTSIKNLATGLLAQGCSVRVLVYGQKGEGIFDDNGVCIQQIQNVKFKGLSWYFTQKKIQKIIDDLYKNKLIDLVEAPDWTGITSFISPKKCPVVIRLNGSDTYFCHLDQRPVKSNNKFHEKRALQKADGLLSVSQFTANLTNQLFGLKRKFKVIPNSIDTNTFTSNINSSTNTNKTILYFGSLIRKKGLLELPLIFNEVIKTNPTVKLILIGRDVSDVISASPSTWQMMQKLFSEKALANTSYLGSVRYADIKEVIDQASVCVFPSFAEALPVSWLEAMAMQKAIVASSIGWGKEVIEDGVNGYLVHPTDHEEYARKIEILLNDSELRSKMGAMARISVETIFDIEKIAQKSIKYYQTLVEINDK
ncbi:glycosyltransferase family 4 protein [Flavobacterium sp. WC2430]|uniref:glycosyltransferase family 4 protein n=1 Tax=Flavobacterium sp. WC2430 TaxID=3234137 RepID=UPI0034660706